MIYRIKKSRCGDYLIHYKKSKNDWFWKSIQMLGIVGETYTPRFKTINEARDAIKEFKIQDNLKHDDNKSGYFEITT